MIPKGQIRYRVRPSLIAGSDADAVALMQMRAARLWALWLRVAALLTIPIEVWALHRWPGWDPWSTWPMRVYCVLLVTAAVYVTVVSARNHATPSTLRQIEDGPREAAALGIAALLAIGSLTPAAILWLVGSIPLSGPGLRRVPARAALGAVGVGGLFALFAALPLDFYAPRWFWYSASALFVIVCAAFAATVWWWEQTERLAVVLDAAEMAWRSEVSITMQHLLHDGVVAAMDRFAAGQPVTTVDRRAVAQLANRIRRDLLMDTVPRSVSRLADDAVEQAALAGIVLIRMEYIEDDPPLSVIAAFHDALSALITNVPKAGVETARLAIDATTDSLHVTLVDDGPGRDPEEPWGPITQDRVFERLASIPGASATPLTQPGSGIMWQLAWERP